MTGDKTTGNIKQNSLKAWIAAVRPRILAIACVPMIISMAYEYSYVYEALRPIPPDDGWYYAYVAILGICYLFFMVMQIDAVFISDYLNCVHGKYTDTPLQPKRACAKGWVSLKAMRWAIGITSVLALLTAFPLVMTICLGVGIWGLIFICVAGYSTCFVYTKYLWLRDLLVIVFYGLVPVYGIYFMLSEDIADVSVYLLAIACGMAVDTLFIIKDYRDIDIDRHAGRRTLAVILGRKNTEVIYLAIVPLAALLTVCAVPTLFSLITLTILSVLHYFTFRRMKAVGQGKTLDYVKEGLNPIIRMTAVNIFLFSILTALPILSMSVPPLFRIIMMWEIHPF